MTETKPPGKEAGIWRSRYRGRHSLFFKLFAILLVTVFLTHLVVGGFYRHFWSTGARAAATANLKHYAASLTREIGVPPDTIEAARIARDLGLDVAIQGPEGWWMSPGFPPRFSERLQSPPPHLKRKLSGDSIRIRLRRGRMLAVVPRDGHVFFYGSRLRQPLESRGLHWLGLTGAISLIWFLAWLMLRHLLRPVRRLAAGVAEVEAGNLEVRLPEKGRGELAELARSFNAMARSLQERLKARDQLLLDVSHELRSPLTRMRVALEMTAPGSATEALKEEVQALEKMVAEILETERLHSGSGGLRRTTVDLGKLMDEVVSAFTGDFGIRWAPHAQALVSADAERIRLVLRNVVENAVKYGSSGPEVRVSLEVDAGFAIAKVRDFGPGIAETEQRLVFEPFYRTDRSRSLSAGYGLGLSLCKRIVEAHGGTISLTSRVGEGTTVEIRLPLSGSR